MLGWIILGSLLCGIGVIFVQPYINATFAEVYAEMRKASGAAGRELLDLAVLRTMRRIPIIQWSNIIRITSCTKEKMIVYCRGEFDVKCQSGRKSHD